MVEVSRKGRRNIIYKNQAFVWWVGENEEDEGRIWLNVVSEDKQIILAYRVGEGDFFVVSKGRFFQGEKTSGCWEKYWYPMQDVPMAVTPKFVHALIAWAVAGRDADKIKE